MPMSKKVFIGLNNIANVGLSLKSGFEELGIIADFYSTEQILHKYDYSEKLNVKINRITYSNFLLIRYIQLAILMIRIVLRYDYFIFLQGGSLLSNFKDIKLLKRMGKKVSVIFAGCDARVPDIVMQYKWNPCRDCSEAYQMLVGCKFPDKYKMLEDINQNFDIIFSPDECGGYFKEKYITYYFPVKDIGVAKTIIHSATTRKSLRIAHAPSNEEYKGSKHIYSAIDNLKNRYEFEFIKLQNLSKDDLIEEILKCDLVIDQMLVGFYGILTVEAMLLQKPVICYIRDDIWNKIGNDCPLYNANPDNLEKVLDNILQNPSQLIKRGEDSRIYALEFHSPKNIAEKMLKIFREEK
jgi:hypothetical protein